MVLNITAKAGKRRVKAVCGLNRTVSPKTAPPRPDIPETRMPCHRTLSTLIPLLAASSGLSATAHSTTKRV